MSVPSHNLYDYIHQVLERKFWLRYFFPWGSRRLQDLIDRIPDADHMNKANGILSHHRLATKILPLKYHDNHGWVKSLQPTILCYDQEPLNFDFYKDRADLLVDFLNHLKQEKGIELSPANKDLNLRYVDTWAWQSQWILLHSEINSPEIKKYENTGYFKCAYWWSHAVLARDWYRFAEHDTTLTDRTTYKKLFLVYCRDTTGSREYRKVFLEKINGTIKDYCQVGSFDGKSAESYFSAEYNSDDFIGTGISLVLETLFEDSRIHLTEKILRAIACRHPFILAAGPGSLELLKTYGFKTFSPWINESYDAISDPRSRLECIIKEMERLTKLSSTELENLLSACKDIADHNQKHFFSKEFYKIVTSELKKNVSIADAIVGDRLDPSLYLENYSWHNRNQKDFQINPVIQEIADSLLEQDQRHQHSLDDKSSANGDDV